MIDVDVDICGDSQNMILSPLINICNHLRRLTFKFILLTFQNKQLGHESKDNPADVYRR